MPFDAIPKDLRGLRACLVCSLVKVCKNFIVYCKGYFLSICN